MTTVIDLRRSNSTLTLHDFLPANPRRHAFLLSALRGASDISRPLMWLARAGVTEQEWHSKLGTDAIPHSLQENLKDKITADRAALEKGQSSTQAFDMIDALQASQALKLVLPYKEGRPAYYTAAHAWLKQQGQTDNPMLARLADDVGQAADDTAYAQRMTSANEFLAELGQSTVPLEQLATARYGQTVLRQEALAYRTALKERRTKAFASGPEGASFSRWLAGSGLGGASGQAQLALDVLETWVNSAQLARKKTCKADCGKCVLNIIQPVAPSCPPSPART